jgi:hypothetical protein
LEIKGYVEDLVGDEGDVLLREGVGSGGLAECATLEAKNEKKCNKKMRAKSTGGERVRRRPSRYSMTTQTSAGAFLSSVLR